MVCILPYRRSLPTHYTPGMCCTCCSPPQPTLGRWREFICYWIKTDQTKVNPIYLTLIALCIQLDFDSAMVTDCMGGAVAWTWNCLNDKNSLLG